MMNTNNVVVFDEKGIPSIMVKFENPRAAVTHPMFIVGGEEVDAIYISKYPNMISNGCAYSLPMVDPKTAVNFDEALKACKTKGEGWHLMTAVEWEFLLDESRRLGTIPHGNTNWGKDYNHEEEYGERSEFGRTLTGSGPATWNHDHTVYGVSDINGNVWEWLAGLRLMEGNIEYVPDNDAALHNIDLSKNSEAWQSVKIGENPVRFKVESGEISITADTEQDEPDYDGVVWDDLQVELTEIPEALKTIGLVPKGDADKEAYVWIDTEGERLPFRGSSFFHTSSSGPSALNLADPRSLSNGNVGFRSAYYEVNGKLIAE